MIAPPCYLLDGPLCTGPDRRDAIKARMVNDLVDGRAQSRDQARRLLYARDFLGFDIELLVDEALAEAWRITAAGGADLDRTLTAIDAAMQEPAP